ncbi:putative transcription factor C2H2 family [Rosa chinensis]|uniref:RING-type E3 ubiquitin transferase n=1 Tax=Rosa chinensis TaxID=74649 RepID=A0A2P6S5C5_ROSCH|nr:RING-H2 finger protein ATL13 [Rosa chinensis]XP_040371408.1 RING-H2 finger protein ATL13 [Rosa chinensis]PRQ53876.1 putative transcription factor C2H2 family [Rosa chinensis]
MSEERNIYRSKIFQSDRPPRPIPEGQIQINLCLFRQSRVWHDDLANFTHDRHSLVRRRADWITPEFLTGRDMRWILFAGGVPLEEQPPILEKIIQFAQVAVPELPIFVVIVHTRVCSLGSVDYQDIIDLVAREPINVNVRASPTPITPTAHAPTVSVLGTYMSLLTIPTSRSSIEGLKKVRFDTLEEDVIRETPTCAICIKDFVECVDELITSLPCAHHYHVDCIVQWLKRDHTCPLCRYQMPPASMDWDGDGDAVEPSNP